MYANSGRRRPRGPRGRVRPVVLRQNRDLGDDTGYDVEGSDEYEYVLDSDGGLGGTPGAIVKVKTPKIPAAKAVPISKLRKYARVPIEEQEEYEYVASGDGSFGDDDGGASAYGVGDSGLGNFFTDLLNIGPKVYVPGVTGSPAPNHYNAWRAAAIARGHTIVRMPSGPQAGEWAEMTVTPDGQKLYGLAPQTVRDEDHQIAAFNQSAANIANIPEAAVAKVASVAGAVGAGARKAVGDTLGIPQWLFPVLLIGGGALVLRQFIPHKN